MKRIVLSLALLLLASSAFAEDKKPPQVVRTDPVNGVRNVDPKQKTISVTFSEPMKKGSWSWAFEKKEDFPKTTGQPHYVENDTKNLLPVELQPKKTYVIWINTKALKNFRDKAGNPAVPYKLTFTTK